LKRVVVGITGASGSIYGKRLVEVLVSNSIGVDLIFSKTGKRVFEFELDLKVEEFFNSLPKDLVNLYGEDDLFAPPSSGSYETAGMVIAPCSGGTLGHIASGATLNLIHRSAEVCLKEKRPLVLVFRETPISRVHAENMLKVIEAGATLLPASPAFYGKPKEIKELVDFIVDKALKVLFKKSFGLSKGWPP